MNLQNIGTLWFLLLVRWYVKSVYDLHCISSHSVAMRTNSAACTVTKAISPVNKNHQVVGFRVFEVPVMGSTGIPTLVLMVAPEFSLFEGTGVPVRERVARFLYNSLRPYQFVCGLLLCIVSFYCDLLSGHFGDFFSQASSKFSLIPVHSHWQRSKLIWCDKIIAMNFY